jgi:hypothetical protein
VGDARQVLIVPDAFGARPTPSPASYKRIRQLLIHGATPLGHNPPHVGKTKQQLQLLTWI